MKKYYTFIHDIERHYIDKSGYIINKKSNSKQGILINNFLKYIQFHNTDESNSETSTINKLVEIEKSIR